MSLRVVRSDLVELIGVPDLFHGSGGEAKAWVTRHDAVEGVGKALCRDHGFPPSVGAADEVGIARLTSIEAIDESLGLAGDLADRGVSEVQPRLLTGAEAGIPALVSRI